MPKTHPTQASNLNRLGATRRLAGPRPKRLLSKSKLTFQGGRQDQQGGSGIDEQGQGLDRS